MKHLYSLRPAKDPIKLVKYYWKLMQIEKLQTIWTDYPGMLQVNGYIMISYDYWMNMSRGALRW